MSEALKIHDRGGGRLTVTLGGEVVLQNDAVVGFRDTAGSRVEWLDFHVTGESLCAFLRNLGHEVTHVVAKKQLGQDAIISLGDSE